jgi:hypothetical protein
MVRSRPATNPLKQIKHILADHRKSGLPTEGRTAASPTMPIPAVVPSLAGRRSPSVTRSSLCWVGPRWAGRPARTSA